MAASREQASTALRRRLVREGFDPDDVEEAVGRALACGLVDDARYADVLVRSRLAQGRGRQGIASELSDLDIDPEGVGALADADEEGSGELERALALLERRPPRAKNQRDAAYRRLVQKGFGADIAASAARLWTESKDA
ncbi:regulatory protein RecX [Gordonibacter sp. An230]|uniref:regulatory protein RecX n=1 Tax=Gordonibacter sp. An230 TaxID=1965592 RepID=UPI001EF5D305|nr:regulatory protein RecX [Gordonibacter sp. An230]